jgi:hypothetical protein
MHRSPHRREMTRPTRTATRRRAYHIEADDLLCQPGDFEDFEDWMIGPNNDTGNDSGNGSSS